MTVSNSLVKKEQGKITFSQAIASPSYQALINNTIKEPKRAQRFVTAVVSAVSANPILQQCEPASVLSAAFQGEALNLSPSPSLGEYWMVPYKTRDKTTGQDIYKAQFQPGVAGIVQLAMRTGLYKDLGTIEIRQGEYKGRNPRNGQPIFEFIEDDDVRENLPVVGYMAYFELLNGFSRSVYFSREKCIQWAAKYSKAFDRKLFEKFEAGKVTDWKEQMQCTAPWYANFSKMAEKTVLKQCLKFAPKSIEMQTLEEADDAADKVGDFDISGTFAATDVNDEFFDENGEEETEVTAKKRTNKKSAEEISEVTGDEF